MNDRFADKTAIVTGAGSGIGLAAALRLAGEGARVVVTDWVAERVDDAVAKINALGRVEAVGVVGNVADQADVDRVVAAAAGRVDVLVNNAGVMDGFVPVGELDDALWHRVLGVNLTGPMRLTRAVLPLMQAAGHGAIVNVASEAGLRAGCSGTAYAVSKHALIGLTRSTAVFYGPSGIRCNAVCPGATATNIDGACKSDFAMSVIGKYLAAIPPVASAEELAAVICWLASDDAANVNGAALPSDNGWSAV